MKDNTKKTLKLYWQFSMQHKLSCFMIVFLVTFIAVVESIIPIYFKKFFDVLSQGNNDQIANALILILISIAIFEFIKYIAITLNDFLITHFQTSVMAKLGNYCYEYLQKHSYAYFNNNFVGSLVKRVQYFINGFEAIHDRLILDILQLMVHMVVILIVLSTRNIFLSVVLFFWAVIYIGINYAFSRYKMKYDLMKSNAETETTAHLADTITNHSNVTLFNGYKREVKEYHSLTDKLRKIRRFSWGLSNVFYAVQSLLMVVLQIGIYYIAIRLWRKGILTIGDFVLIQAYLINMFMRIWNFGRVLVKMYERLADAEEMTIVLNMPHEIKDIPQAKELKVDKGMIEFKDVSFYYHKTRAVLKKFNLKIKPGEKIALIGPSGAGKTTVVRLLLRIYDISDGKILIDDQKINRVTQESLWKNVSMVPQDPMLFHRTLEENIKYGNPNATDKQVIEASKAAYCHDFINELSKGYQTYVGERGIKLSGGERQRVAIARAILHNSRILVLDEATSSLDSESETLIQQALEKLMKGKTVIVIAHRLSTIKKMDRIVTIDKGGIIEDGTHQELIKSDKGLYKKLWELQAGGFI